VQLLRQVSEGPADVVDTLLTKGDKEQREGAKLPEGGVGLGNAPGRQIPVVLLDLVASGAGHG
jgi:hypothetical protein